MADTTHLRNFNYPTMNAMEQGFNPAPTVDRTGRPQIRMDEAPMPDSFKRTAQGSQQYTNILRNIATERGLSPSTTTGPEVTRLIQMYGGTPDKLAMKLHTTDPKKQALMLLRIVGKV